MSLFLRDLKRTVKHPEWLNDAYHSLDKAMRLRAAGKMPAVLEVSMTVTPIRRMLRCIYGDNWTAVFRLAYAAGENTWSEVRGAVVRFWRYRVRMQSPDRDLNEMCEDCDEE